MPATFLLLSCARSAALVVFLMLTESADNALFAADGGFEFLVEAGKNIAIIAAKSIEHGFGEIGESLQSQLQFMLKIRVLWASICHKTELRCKESVLRWPGNGQTLRQNAQFRSSPAEFTSQFDELPGYGKLLFCLAR